MSTRGLFGFRLKGKSYLQFSPSDSYPSGLGKFWIEKIRKYDLNKMKEVLINSNNIFVKENEDFSKKLTEEMNVSKDYANEIIEWYDGHAKNGSGIFDALYEGITDLFFNDKAFARDSLFCEYIYYYDYDSNKFVMVDNHEENVIALPVESEDWQKNLSVV